MLVGSAVFVRAQCWLGYSVGGDVVLMGVQCQWRSCSVSGDMLNARRSKVQHFIANLCSNFRERIISVVYFNNSH